MASLIVRGELDSGEPPLPTPVYVRPVLRPNQNAPAGTRYERIPEDVLPVDLIHRAVRRLFETAGETPPVAPTVRIVNFSIGDPARVFVHQLSPLARLIDWLSWHYNVLFIVSCGNHPGRLELDIAPEHLRSASAAELEKASLRAVISTARHRRLLAPAESINALTVGALHADRSGAAATDGLFNLFSSPGLPSPANALGLGFRRSVKPDILVPGGRLLYREPVSPAGDHCALEPADRRRAPGQQVARPGRTPGELGATNYVCGSSNAAALTSRLGAQLSGVLALLRNEPGGEIIRETTLSVLLKALLVHSSRWGSCVEVLQSLLKASHPNGKLRENLGRFLGYGSVEPERVFGCTNQRATLVGAGHIAADEAQGYSFPLPPSLAGRKLGRRLTMTLAWFSPINPQDRRYRRAALLLDPIENPLALTRTNNDYHATRRGTIQHEVLEGQAARAYADGDSLAIRVSCRAEAGELTDPVPYGLVATLEVTEDVFLPIYEEVRTRVRPAVQVRPSAS